MARERPIIERKPPDDQDPIIIRGIISPCTGCLNNRPVPTSLTDYEQIRNNPNLVAQPWPCPKQMLYTQKAKALNSEYQDTSFDYDHPVYDEKLKGINPVWPGISEHNNHYAYVFIATFEDNIDNGWNPGFADSSRMRCRGPFLIASSEKGWNILGRLQQRETILAFLSYYYIDGAQFKGFVLDAATWQVANGYTRKVDKNLGFTFSGGE